MHSNWRLGGRVFLFLLCLFFSYQLLFTSSHWIFLDYANLFIHEGGHFLFFFLGQFLYILGGSLTQIVLPCCFLIYFLRRDEYFSVMVMLFWVADNIVNVSRYVSDAQKMQLPLLGGESSIHDWNYLLTHTGLLPWTDLFGAALFIFGVLLLILSLSGMIFFLRVAT